MSDELVKQLDRLRQENASLRRQVVAHPAAEALRFVAPFIDAAIDGGLWPKFGGEAVSREMCHALSYIDGLEP